MRLRLAVIGSVLAAGLVQAVLGWWLVDANVVSRLLSGGGSSRIDIGAALLFEVLRVGVLLLGPGAIAAVLVLFAFDRYDGSTQQRKPIS